MSRNGLAHLSLKITVNLRNISIEPHLRPRQDYYDHDEDPDENVNVADRPEHKELITRLSQQLHAAVNAGKTDGQ